MDVASGIPVRPVGWIDFFAAERLVQMSPPTAIAGLGGRVFGPAELD